MRKLFILLKSFFLFSIVIQYLFNKKLSDLHMVDEKYIIKEEKKNSKNFFNLKLFNPKNKELINKERHDILKMISQGLNKKISSIKNISFIINCNFGNCLSYLNKFIFYCEIIGCESILLDNKSFWFIKNTIKLKNNNITIKVDNKKNLKNTPNYLFYNSFKLWFTYFNLKPEIRINLVREEILKNLPYIECSEKDLFIHVRSGDVFSLHPHFSYHQPPLCFYETILNNFQFKKIYLISSDNINIIVKKLLNKYNSIIYNKNSLKVDISLLINAYIIVNSISSFSTSIIYLNKKLKVLYDYNLYEIKQKIRHYHYDLYNLYHKNYIVFRMEPSKKYKIKMYKWKNTKKQRKLMLKEKCNSSFKIKI